MDSYLQINAEQMLGFARNLCRVDALLHRNSGEKFNVFRVLKIQRYETRTHSPMLRELLDPRGVHGQGSMFLKLFMTECGVPESAFQVEGATVSEEYYIGPKTQNSGGRMDLLLRDRRGKMLGIENKIDAGDEENQVERYRHFLGRGELLYLTLNGRVPSNSGDIPAGTVRCISYREHVTRWLEACRCQAATAPLVRETLSQYLHLVKELTHQNESTSMDTELAQAALHNSGDLRAFFSLCNARTEVEAQIVEWLNGKLDIIAARHCLDRPDRLKNFRQRYDGFSFTSALLQANNLCIRFEFEGHQGNGFAFGFRYASTGNSGECAEKLRELFEEHFGKPHASADWPAWATWSEYETWSDEMLTEIRFGDRFLNELEERLACLNTISARLFP